MALIGLLSIKKLNSFGKNTGLFRLLFLFALSQFSFVGIAKAESVKDEQDKILMLLAYSIVFQDWVRPTDKNKRGHNIGAVLFDNDAKKIVGAQLNSVLRCDDKTQHAEVRLMQQCLSEKCLGGKSQYLTKANVTIYTSLEPCMMCSGMMIFLGVSGIVYGQTDPDYGQSIERLKQSFDKNCGYEHSQCIVDKPGNYYTRRITSEPSKLLQKEKLDGAYFNYELLHGDYIVSFLLSDDAKEIYQEAFRNFKNLDIRHKENRSIYRQALSTLKQLENGELQLDYCPSWQSHHHHH
ncbi:nucleoside deaminase [Microbulbifer sp. ANSA003]|uniref:nucleoside deaminase n=1 Tax=Microbulbifer sp. ANSA003 TaxID=3243360 RepID=UPI00404118A0